MRKQKRFVIWDLAARPLQLIVHKKYYGGFPANSFEPYRRPENRTQNGVRVISDLRYGNTYPNSFLDIMLPVKNSRKPYPVIVYFHGGGVLFGRKVSGDPLVENQMSSLGMLYKFVEEGYAVVNCDYALAPKFRFPTQIIQVNEVLAYLNTVAAIYDLDMDRLVISGGSAGADFTELYCTALCNPEYAEKLGFVPSIRLEQVRAAILDEPALRFPFHDRNMNIMLGSFVGSNNVTDSDVVKLASAHCHIRPGFPPSFVIASNEDRFFKENSEVLIPVLETVGSPYVEIYPDPDKWGTVPHGFMSNLGTPVSNMAIEQLLPFLKHYVYDREGGSIE